MNRFFLILSMFGGILIPLVPSTFSIYEFPFLSSGLNSIYTLDEFIVSSTRNSGVSFADFLIGSITFIYGSLVIMKLYLSILEFSRLMNLTKQKQEVANNIYIHYTDSVTQPFSFLNIIVMPKFIANDLKSKEIIIAHECTHIRYKHYCDLLFLKILEILLPYHPCLHFFRKELLLIHEYQADEQAIKSSNQEEYYKLLIEFSQKSSMHATIVNSFYYSPIKSRIMMLFKKSSRLQYVNLGLVPFLFMACLYLNSHTNKSNSTLINHQISTDRNTMSPSYQIWDTELSIKNSSTQVSDSTIMPKFPGGDKALMEFLGNNIVYPANGKKNKIQGTSYIKFVVFEDGSIHNITIHKSLGKEFDQELRRIMKLMPDWIPASQAGKNAKAEFTLPVKFKLTD